jgi:hypothetical protein
MVREPRSLDEYFVDIVAGKLVRAFWALQGEPEQPG